MTNAPSPLDVALQLPSPGSTLIIQSAGPWSPVTHRLFPPDARRTAVDLLCLGYLLINRNMYGLDTPEGLLDPWMLIIQLVVGPRHRKRARVTGSKRPEEYQYRSPSL
mmetsp:Transcript_12919/g.29478  ORF Transcript_12919/g.29478 Transcript_12919/m.29478 type:complete len:108 (+) Transcript_12919:556-879(+)